METLRKEISNFVSDKTATLITSSIFCFTAGLLVSHWSRRLYGTLKARRVCTDRADSNAAVDGGQTFDYDKRVVPRSRLTFSERCLAKEAAEQLIVALEKYKQDNQQRDGSRISHPGGETGTGFGERDLYICECDQRMYDEEDDDNTF